MSDSNLEKPAAAATEKPVGNKNEKVGSVVSAKMAKTIVVEVMRRVPHPAYKRIVSRRKRFYAHDEQGAGQGRRRGAHRGVPPAEQAEALAIEGSGAQGGAGDHGSELDRD